MATYRFITRAALVLCLLSPVAADAQVPQETSSQSAAVDRELWREDALGSKLFLGPTGRALKKGDGYFAINALFLPAFQYGVTDRLSIGVGKPFYFMNATTYVTPKYQVYRGDKACVSTGLVHVFIPGTGMGGLVYSSATIGRPEGAITVGGGWVHAEGDDERGGTAVVMIGGDKRLTRRTSFVTDNYIFAGGAIISGGARWVGRTTSFEAGAMIAGGGGYIGPPGVFFNVIFHPAR